MTLNRFTISMINQRVTRIDHSAAISISAIMRCYGNADAFHRIADWRVRNTIYSDLHNFSSKGLTEANDYFIAPPLIMIIICDKVALSVLQ